MKRLLFSKKLRLLSEHEFTYAFQNSSKFITKEMTVFFSMNNLKHPRIGIIISKKNIKYAYKRNNIKRHIRENFRINQHILPNMDFIITIHKNTFYLNNSILNEKLKLIWCYNYNANL